MYFNNIEKKVISVYEANGFLISNIREKNLFKEISNKILFHCSNILKKKLSYKFFDYSHNYINIKDLNEIRLLIINDINKDSEIKKIFFSIFREFLYTIAGNELVMQKNINLSIQMPSDDSSLLDVHSDTWAGDSPYEVVGWLPLVNCYKTKSMFILNNTNSLKYSREIFNKKSINFSFKKKKKKVNWLKINKGQLLIFNQNLIHGNQVNMEKTTRWSLNCRFKSIFTPYSEKKLGDFFEPVTLRPASSQGMKYVYPIIKK